MNMKEKLKMMIYSGCDDYILISEVIKCLKEEYDDEIRLEEVMYIYHLNCIEINNKRYREVEE